jgi:hypothetical protein
VHRGRAAVSDRMPEDCDPRGHHGQSVGDFPPAASRASL